MDAYTGFAYVYDEYMDNIPYEEWGQYMIALLKENGVSGDSSVLELGCGTGTVTRMLAKEGYDCVGLDMSEDMLSIASEKTFEEGSQVIYTCQDMRDFEVPYEVDGMISIGDSMNYITSVPDLESVFACVSENLKKGGVFIFDLRQYISSVIYLLRIHMLRTGKILHLYGTTIMMRKNAIMNMSLLCLLRMRMVHLTDLKNSTISMALL